MNVMQDKKSTAASARHSCTKTQTAMVSATRPTRYVVAQTSVT